MPYKNKKTNNKRVYATRTRGKQQKKQTGIIILLILLSLLSLSFVGVIIGLESGVITFPSGTFSYFPLLQQYERPASILPSNSEATESEAAPPAEPPKLTYDGAFDEAAIKELEAVLAKNPWSVSVYYENLSTGAVVEFNSRRKFPAGSVVKAPYCKWLMTTDPDLTELIAMQQSSIADGGGKIKNEPIGTEFTVQQLIEYSLIESDNTAYQMLTQRYGFDGYLAYVKDMGVGSNISKGNLFGSLSPVGTSVLFKDIYNFSLTDPARSELIMTCMGSTAYSGPIGGALGIPVAHKYGWNGGNNGFHDAAIVYREVPYVLAVFSNLNYEKSGTVDYIKDIVRKVDSLNS